MPGNIFSADISRPNFTGRENVEQKVAALEDYLYLLLEELRYALRNIGPENINQTEVVQWLDSEGVGGGVDAEQVVEIIEAGSVVTGELYAAYGDIADVTVWKLRTDWLRAQNYRNGVTEDINYLYIHDETIEFITASVVLDETGQPAGAEQLTRDGLAFYWADETMSRMTAAKVTPWPVMVYVYEEAVKARFAFQFDQNTGYWVPRLDFGQGDENGNDRLRLHKGPSLAEFLYLAAGGKEIGMTMSLEGYTDLYGMRKSTVMDFSRWDEGVFSETVDGDVREEYAVEFDGSGRPVKITDGAGHETGVVW